jgi:hypothetical protein
MIWTRHFLGVAVVVGLAGASAVAAAQPGGATGGQGPRIGQGEARITAQSDVRLALESERGTSSQRLEAIGRAVGGKMTEVRACYATATEADPTIQGYLRIRITVPQGRGRAAVDVTEDRANNEVLSRCILRSLRAADLTGIPGPAAAVVSLEFDNTAARGVTRMREGSQARVEEAVRVNAAGLAESSGGTGEGEVRFTLTAASAGDNDAVTSFHRALAGRIAGLLDCRRRAGRRGRDPAGQMEVTLRINGRRVANATAANSTVGDANAPRCVQNALRQLPLEGTARGQVRLAITFAGGAAEPAPAPAPRRRP